MFVRRKADDIGFGVKRDDDDLRFHGGGRVHVGIFPSPPPPTPEVQPSEWRTLARSLPL